ncbi:hypothetical protein Bamy01_28970 [Bacillus amyloliquefaciens]|nr:hypothetical protein Bamy01_28970 [Bacillus amyloliquefaciens]
MKTDKMWNVKEKKGKESDFNGTSHYRTDMYIDFYYFSSRRIAALDIHKRRKTGRTFSAAQLSRSGKAALYI